MRAKKIREPETTSAAGKYLRKMDLPLASREPSPPYRRREVFRLARRCPIALLKPCPERPLRVEATRARFEFVGRTHGRKFTLKLQPDEGCTDTFSRNESNSAAVSLCYEQ